MSSADFRRETEWKVVKKFFPVYLEMFCDLMYADGIYEKSRWGETIERRKIALPNHGSKIVYRRIGSNWDCRRGPRPSRSTPIPKKK